MKVNFALPALLAVALAAPQASPPQQSENPAIAVVRRWAPNDRVAQMNCQGNGVKLNDKMHDCDGKPLTPNQCMNLCMCINGVITCKGWNKCSEKTVRSPICHTL